MKKPLAFAVALFVAGCLIGDAGCKHPAVPSGATLEAGVVGVDGICTLLEGITENQTVISICATVEEVAWIVATFAPLLDPTKDAGPIATHTPQEMGKIIQATVVHRRARLLLDAGAR